MALSAIAYAAGMRDADENQVTCNLCGCWFDCEGMPPRGAGYYCDACECWFGCPVTVVLKAVWS